MSEQLAELGQQRLLAAPADDQLDASAAAWPPRELSPRQHFHEPQLRRLECGSRKLGIEGRLTTISSLCTSPRLRHAPIDQRTAIAAAHTPTEECVPKRAICCLDACGGASIQAW